MRHLVVSSKYMNIRPARESDLPRITEIYNEAVLNGVATFDTEPKTLEDRKRWFQQFKGKYGLFVAESDGNIAGYAGLFPFSERAAYDATVENSVYIWPEHQGRGVGRALMQKLVDHANANGVHTILAKISDGNEASIKLHQKFGFVPVGVLKEVGRKFGRVLDVHIMQLIFKNRS